MTELDAVIPHHQESKIQLFRRVAEYQEKDAVRCCCRVGESTEHTNRTCV